MRTCPKKWSASRQKCAGTRQSGDVSVTVVGRSLLTVA